ncbi:Phage tail tube protein [Caloranaerobacter azorensis DSM 13643]|uniref:Phage tail tube protein n=1 Tax=Caloranaerobacter azorensis DSM 13643 TaxID=1121264 RepID=A0A1M5TW81_9FIRM|nr:phage tail tube protein [Caloranaerobacter azorensis]SHH55047.1 Phage tail tube protein [Caloranaerobacter azorensis DSM 13643]
MADNYTRLSDTLSAKEGKAYITINGQNRELFEISKLSAQIDLIVQSRRMLGHRMTQHKVVGAEGTGSMTMYFMNSEMLNQAIQYLKTGNYKGLKLQIKNEDPQSTVGKQEVVLSNVILNSIPAAILDDQSDDPITFDTDFTFDDIENLESFQLPENYR